MKNKEDMFKRVFFHRLILADKVRMSSYKKAILEVVKKGDIVCDIGTGSGILSFFSILAGAKRTYAIEKDEAIIKEAKNLAQANGLKKIIFIKGRSDKVELPEKVNVVISEILGSFGIEENVVKFQIDARERFLTAKGKLIPSWLDLYLVAVESSELWRNYVDIWDKNFYGLDFSVLKKYAVSNRYMTDCLGKMYFLAKPSLIYHIDFYKDNDIEPTFKGKFIITRKGIFHGLIGYFKAGLSENTVLSTSPQDPATHWKKIFLPMQESVSLKQDDVVYYILKVIRYKNEIFWGWRVEILRDGIKIADFNQTNLDIKKEDLAIGREDFKPALTQEAEIYRRIFNLCNNKRTIREIAKIIFFEYPAKYKTIKSANSTVMSILYENVKPPASSIEKS